MAARGARLLAGLPPLEAILWLAGFIVLYFVGPESPRGADLCLFRRLGLGACPGCGLGAAIHHILHGNLGAAWSSNPLGFPAVLILGWRIASLSAAPLSGRFSSLRSKGA